MLWWILSALWVLCGILHFILGRRFLRDRCGTWGIRDKLMLLLMCCAGPYGLLGYFIGTSFHR